MGGMEQRDMNNKAMIKDVELPHKRAELIVVLLDLMDSEYQKRTWIKEGNDISFQQEIWFPFDMFFNEMFLDNYLESKTMPYDKIGYSLKSEKEAEKLYKVCEILDTLCQSCVTNDEYLSSPHLPKLHQAAREAFEAFMENEKDNKEFCNFIEELKKKEGRS